MTNNVTPRDSNFDLIRDIFSLVITATSDPDETAITNALPQLDGLLEEAYRRILSACENNAPGCDLAVATQFQPPGSPGAAPDWVSAWWDFSSP